MIEAEIERVIDRAVALMRHRPPCPRCRSTEITLFDNTRAHWRCTDCGQHFISQPPAETRQ